MRLQVAKWGNSLALRLPAAYAKQAGISDGDTLEATVTVTGELRISPRRPATDPGEVWDKVEALCRTLPVTESVLPKLRDQARY